MPPAHISECDKPKGFEIVGVMTAEFKGWVYWWKSAQHAFIKGRHTLTRAAGWHREYKINAL